ncbi:MAG TPA: hypothetical protein PK466_08355 [Thermotogota bacterium]|nr:hypothetical protein [Thermotogota bacterium]HPJ87844.1 hypothetical protein [Thermotogota bacterium]HPR96328.1 hypothetical protein [Thermotogota bacterium]
MKNRKTIVLLVSLMIFLSAITALTGILSNDERGLKQMTSVNGQPVELYGKGIYHNMSADVAVQGIAQDYVTVFIGIPMLILGLSMSRKNALRGRLFLAGIVGYFLVTFLFYTVMGMYNECFLLYAALMGLSFFTLSTILFGVDLRTIKDQFDSRTPTRGAGIFLLINAAMIALMWLQVVVPPLLDGSLYPKELQHYTTLIVQGMDLGLLLPLCVVSAVLFMRKKDVGYLTAPVYLAFLSLLMTALLAKIIGMSMIGVEAGPALIIIPIILCFTCLFTWLTYRKIEG